MQESNGILNHRVLIVCLIICSGADRRKHESWASLAFWEESISTDQRKHQSSAPLAFVRGIHWWLVHSPRTENVSIWWHHHEYNKQSTAKFCAYYMGCTVSMAVTVLCLQITSGVHECGRDFNKRCQMETLLWFVNSLAYPTPVAPIYKWHHRQSWGEFLIILSQFKKAKEWGNISSNQRVQL